MKFVVCYSNIVRLATQRMQIMKSGPIKLRFGLSGLLLLVWLTCLICLTFLPSQPLFAQQVAIGNAELPDGLETVEFFSPAVNRQMKFDIVLPPDYHESERRYPVLYLLHGHMQNYTVWGRFLGAAEQARRLGDLIVVMPDVGNSWYVNYARSENGQSNNWEDHLIRDLIPFVDETFRTEARREGRAIAGLSMGGFGALSLGLRHARLFISLGSTSGALSHARTIAAAIRAGQAVTTARPPEPSSSAFRDADEQIAQLIAIEGFGTQQERTPAGIAFETAEQADAYDPFAIIYDVPRSAMPHLYLDAGTSDPLIADARELAQLLMVNNVPFDYRQGEGGHTAAYWRESIAPMMAVQNEVMQKALGRR
jgi:enterochelin esterase-like enzyme